LKTSPAVSLLARFVPSSMRFSDQSPYGHMATIHSLGFVPPLYRLNDCICAMRASEGIP
jgi:hypothetical protein